MVSNTFIIHIFIFFFRKNAANCKNNLATLISPIPEFSMSISEVKRTFQKKVEYKSESICQMESETTEYILDLFKKLFERVFTVCYFEQICSRTK